MKNVLLKGKYQKNPSPFTTNPLPLQKGFTFIELLVIIGITAVLFGFITFNLTKAQKNTSLQSTIDSLVADIESQQLQAMEGSTGVRSSSDNYGIYFQPNTYSLFFGSTYFPTDTTNFVVNTDSTISITTTLPNNLLIFSKLSGKILGWAQGNNTITLTNTTDNTTKTITLNQYGVITSIQ